MNREEYLKNKLEEFSPFYIKGFGNQLAIISGYLELEKFGVEPPILNISGIKTFYG